MTCVTLTVTAGIVNPGSEWKLAITGYPGTKVLTWSAISSAFEINSWETTILLHLLNYNWKKLKVIVNTHTHARAAEMTQLCTTAHNCELRPRLWHTENCRSERDVEDHDFTQLPVYVVDVYSFICVSILRIIARGVFTRECPTFAIMFVECWKGGEGNFWEIFQVRLGTVVLNWRKYCGSRWVTLVLYYRCFWRDVCNIFLGISNIFWNKIFLIFCVCFFMHPYN